MSFLDRLEKRFGNWAVPNMALGIVILQLVAYAMVLTGRISLDSIILEPIAVIKGGEIWRVITFVFAPPYIAEGPFNALFLAIFWYLFWMMSGALEAAWGVFKFNVYLLAGILFTIIGAFVGYFISPGLVGISPQFLYTSIFLAFAVFHPNIEFLLMFVIPVKVKWLAIFVGGITLFGILFAPTWGYRLAGLGSVMNFILFFRGALVHSVQARKRRAEYTAQVKEAASEAFHTCSVCGATDQTAPERDFRYKNVSGEMVCICENCR